MNYETGPIRPPSEAESLFVRVNRNCPWNKCLFCPVYKKRKFSRRTLDEIKEDILSLKEAADKVQSYAVKMGYSEVNRQVLENVYRNEPDLLQIAFWMHRGGRNVFLQDADSMIMDPGQLSEALSFLKEQFPRVERITTYARSKTISKRSVSELEMLKDAGLTRVHVGMETGHDPLLEYMKKGVTSEEQVQAGLLVKEAGLSLSEYILLGLGGQEWWKEHALDTARMLSRIDPHFIRLRTLAVRKGIPLQEKIDAGEFKMQDDDGLARELKLFLENLECNSYMISDHILNLLEEVEGQLPDDKPYLLGVVDRYLDMPDEKRANYQLGRRLGYYRYMADMEDQGRFQQMEELRKQLLEKGQNQADFLREYIKQYV